jgi:hypothetical protein
MTSRTSKRVFLGGTCNSSVWRDQLKPLLKGIEYFDPVVVDWTPACQQEELFQRATCNFVLYTISKEMLGVYSIAEAVDDSNKRPEKTILCILGDGFDKIQMKSLDATAKLVGNNGAMTFYTLLEVAEYLNARA